MATATVPAGLGKAAYNDAVKAASNERDLVNYQSALDEYTKNHNSSLTLLRSMRQLYVDNFSAYGVEYLQNAISELEYRVRSAKQNMKDTQTRIDRIKGNTTVVDDDDE